VAYGYIGKILTVDLTNQRIGTENLDEINLRDYVGGSGFAVPWIYKEVPPGVDWSSPENCMVFATGPLTGTVAGTGSFTLSTKGPMTNGIISVQANGFFGAYLKFAGFDAIIVRGSSDKWVYLYVHDGTAELKDAKDLKGKDTWETQDEIQKQLDKTDRQLSVQAIGPAGENLVRFACLAGDHGHIAAHGGGGAVMGSKKLKAIAIERGKYTWPIYDKEAIRDISLKALEQTKVKSMNDYYHWGTLMVYRTCQNLGHLPVKNFNEYVFNETEKYLGSNLRPQFKEKRHPCWACQHHHCSIIEIIDGPYAGFIGEEPEYEGLASMGSLVDQKDPIAATVLSNETDRYGLDVNETGWILSWLMECNEKNLLTRNDTDGIDMTWGNAESMRTMLRKIAYREGIGNMLAEGTMRAAAIVGTPAADLAIYTTRGNTPRSHDHRRGWSMMLDTAVSDYGVDEEGILVIPPVVLGLPPTTDMMTPEGAAAINAAGCGRITFYDTLVICKNTLNGADWDVTIKMLNAATGWDFTANESKIVMRRIKNIARSFNTRHGLGRGAVSPKYGSMPREGLGAGKSFYEIQERAIDCYHEFMGWDKTTGKPLPETLHNLKLDYIINDLYPQKIQS